MLKGHLQLQNTFVAIANFEGLRRDQSASVPVTSTGTPDKSMVLLDAHNVSRL
jgi:hypothetical protein